MSKREVMVVAAGLSVMCPLLTGVAGWWASAALHLAGIGGLTERHVAIIALGGLGVGLLLDVLWLRCWVAAFYSASRVRLAALYLPCSAIALASFMGVPVGLLLCGTLAGVYVGRRAFHGEASADSFVRTRRHAAWFIAAVTGTEALVIGLLVLRERSVVQFLADVLHAEPAAVAGLVGVLVVVALDLVLVAIQFWCTSTAASVAFGVGQTPGRRSGPPGAPQFLAR